MGDNGTHNAQGNESAKDETSATSKKTLSDIEADEKDTSANSDDNTSAPSPDGQFDESKDQNDKTGPM